MTDDQIKHMVERFLSWRLPENFNPDGGISAVRPNYGPDVHWVLTGTNLLDHDQATGMVRHMVEALPVQPSGSHVDRMRIEFDELDVRTKKLTAFMATEDFAALNGFDQVDLSIQAAAMEGYRVDLYRRLCKAIGRG